MIDLFHHLSKSLKSSLGHLRDYAILLIISFSRSIENVSWWDSDEFNRLEGFKHKLTSDPKGQSISACWKAWYPYNLSK